MGSTIFGSLAALVLLTVWTLFPDHRIAQGIFLLMAVVGFTGLLQVHRLTLDLDSRRWSYWDGWTWQSPRAEGTLDDLACVAIETNELHDGLVASKLRSRLVFLEFADFDLPDHEGRFPLGFAMGPNIAPDQARRYADLLGVEVDDRTGGAVRGPASDPVSDPPPKPASSSPATPPDA